jgi:hypothetical protein
MGTEFKAKHSGCLKFSAGFLRMTTGVFLFVLVFVQSGATCAQSTRYERLIGDYIRKYSGVAVLEMQQYSIPASITLAQGILESGAGQSRLAVEANNHFGIKCHKDWKGEKFLQDDEGKNECFRKYGHAEESFRDHSLFLSGRERYRQLFSLKLTDYKGWARGLQSAGYATNPGYADRLIRIIEDNQLNLYDQPGTAPALAGAGGNPDLAKYPWIETFEETGKAADGRRIYRNNGISCVVVKHSETLSGLSSMLGIPEKKLRKFNDLGVGQGPEEGMVVYLKSKKRKSSTPAHIASGKESLYEISQRYGLKMKVLLKRTGMSEGIMPYAGQRIPLR